jgi:flagellar biosynthesis/type III secretory pathway protein FliH
MLGSFFKTTKYKKFEFAPRYYDERKERREELIKQLEEEDRAKKAGSISDYQSHLKKGYLSGYRKKVERKESKNSMVRIAIILTVLIAIFYWLLR